MGASQIVAGLILWNQHNVYIASLLCHSLVLYIFMHLFSCNINQRLQGCDNLGCTLLLLTPCHPIITFQVLIPENIINNLFSNLPVWFVHWQYLRQSIKNNFNKCIFFFSMIILHSLASSIYSSNVMIFIILRSNITY